MDEFVARIYWEGLDVATGASEGCELLCRLDDIVVVRREITLGSRMLQEKMRESGHLIASNREEFGRIVAEIEADPKAKEVIGEWYQKSIQLSPTYNFGYSEHPENKPTVGFGLSGHLGRVTTEPTCSMTFSWDWFNVNASGKASKIQESGEINIKLRDTPCGNEIVHMEFETDVSIRICKQETARTLQPDWRITLLAGSEIWWPSLGDGNNLANGFIS